MARTGRAQTYPAAASSTTSSSFRSGGARESGGVLLDAVLAEAKRRNYSRIHLWTHEDNERSHRLYLSRGFSRTGRVSDDEGEWARNLSELVVEDLPGSATIAAG